jgi:hypothetical protein
MDAVWVGFKGWYVMGKAHCDLTGAWHGLYSYDQAPTPVYFVATLMNGATWVSGTSHEAVNEIPCQDLTLFATLDGQLSGHAISFTKTYDGTGGWSHRVPYQGTISPDVSEIEGTWSIHEVGYLPTRGRFLMIRNSGASEAMVREAFEVV